MRRAPNKRGHRDSIDIVADILKASLGGAKKTQLMYNCNLSFPSTGIISWSSFRKESS